MLEKAKSSDMLSWAGAFLAILFLGGRALAVIASFLRNGIVALPLKQDRPIPTSDRALLNHCKL